MFKMVQGRMKMMYDKLIIRKDF